MKQTKTLLDAIRAEASRNGIDHAGPAVTTAIDQAHREHIPATAIQRGLAREGVELSVAQVRSYLKRLDGNGQGPATG